MQDYLGNSDTMCSSTSIGCIKDARNHHGKSQKSREVGTCSAVVKGRQRGGGVAGVVGVGGLLSALRRAHLAQDGGAHLLPLRLQLLH